MYCCTVSVLSCSASCSSLSPAGCSYDEYSCTVSKFVSLAAGHTGPSAQLSVCLSVRLSVSLSVCLCMLTGHVSLGSLVVMHTCMSFAFPVCDSQHALDVVLFCQCFTILYLRLIVLLNVVLDKRFSVMGLVLSADDL